MVPYAADSEESAVGDFAVALFHALGYIHRPRTLPYLTRAVRIRKKDMTFDWWKKQACQTRQLHL